MDNKIVNYNITDAAISEMRANYLKLQIMGLEDKDGAKAVRSARLVVKAHRCNVERLRKELKADALEWGRRVDAEAKRIMGLLEPIESHLKAEEDRLEAEKEVIRKAEEERLEAIRREEAERVAKRIALFAAAGANVTFEAAQAMTDEDFREQLAEAVDAFETMKQIERERSEKEAAERKAEQDRIDEENRLAREELERERAAQKVEAERLAKERAEIDAEKAARDLREKEEKRKIWEQEEAERRRQEKIAEELKAAAQAPDLAKLIDWGRAILDASDVNPGIVDPEIEGRRLEARDAVYTIISGVL